MSVKYAILGLLHGRDMHGYGLKEQIRKDFGQMWSVNYGQIYPMLRKLEQDGLVSMIEVAQKDHPHKKLYSITPAGKKDFAEWLNNPAENELMIKDPFLLRFAFYGQGKKESAVAAIDMQLKCYEDSLADRLNKLEKRPQANDYSRLLAELGVGLNQVMIEWLGRARAELAGDSAGAPPREYSKDEKRAVMETLRRKRGAQ